MFQWDKSINAINVPACKVVHLFRSMREVQLALPGVSAQQASAYLCQYQLEGGIGTIAVFHLHKSKLLAFYFSEPRAVAEQKTDSMLDHGLNFVESMGFLMTDQDIHLLDDADQEMLWASLPIKAGLPEEKESPLASASAKKQLDEPVEKSSAKVETNSVATISEKKKEPPVIVTDNKAETNKPPADRPEQLDLVAEPDSAASDNVDDLLKDLKS